MNSKPAAASVTVKHELVLPSDTNAMGTAFGGSVMGWIDICAAITAQRHCGSQVVTAAMDQLHFHAPILVGMTAVLNARINATFNHSVEVGVSVVAENCVTGQRTDCCSAVLTFTAVDGEFHPQKVPQLELHTDEDRALQKAGEARRARRLAERKTH
jgi:acyl-CoA hydrolase